MQPYEVRSLVGRTCHVTVRCSACGREHSHGGTVGAGPHGGDITLSGIVYSVEDIVSINITESPSPALALPVFLILRYATVAALLATWLRLVRR